jgi:hypothetical protein
VLTRTSVGIGTGCLILLTSPTLAWAPPLGITIVDSSIALNPGQTEYETGYVEATGTAGILVEVDTNNSTGLILYVRCDDATPEIALSDLLVRSQTPGTLIPSYTAITATDQALWSTSDPVDGEDVDTDVRIQGLWSYSDAAGGGTTTYTNTLTYTVVDQ